MAFFPKVEMKHRCYFPGMILLSLVFGPVQSLIYFYSYGSIVSYLPSLMLGLFVGAMASAFIARWIKRSVCAGVVNLGWRPEIVIVMYFSVGLVMGYIVNSHPSWICPLLQLENELGACEIAASAFMSTWLLAFLICVYIWGLVYERRLDQPLRYRAALPEYVSMLSR